MGRRAPDAECKFPGGGRCELSQRARSASAQPSVARATQSGWVNGYGTGSGFVHLAGEDITASLSVSGKIVVLSPSQNPLDAIAVGLDSNEYYVHRTGG